MKKIYEIAQESAINGKFNQDIAIDFTCGNGGDSAFLSEHFHQVYAYDIQLEAIEHAKARHLDNVCFKHKSHELFDEDVQNFDVGMFNLGYLPSGDKKIYTNQEVVIRTIDKALKRLNKYGRIIITCYPGFDHGEQEAQAIEKFCANLASKHYDVAKFNLINRIKSPYIIVIDKH